MHWNLAMFDRSSTLHRLCNENPVNYKPYWMLNTKLMYKDKRLTFFAELNNILNQKYVEFGGIEQPGINFNTGIKIALN